ncbi:hypothetical protein IFR09_02765 [Pseudomonas syringae]|nr:hypothetical protein [Pseudomonas syringae]MBD8573242.1 hypothetical protein [Pseudomonas syringae]MBD8790246.1 hypothetical protein [Pseudomonas syringae]MBD8799256.1 hypothetical protein [Pseudomonas syringae]MBD8810082.1 hypothetical protein [Pseudomonas syringae]
MLETLCTLKCDLEEAAAHLESLSVTMSGHFTFLSQRGGHVDGVDATGHIASLNASVQRLRTVASTIE